jgi:hypothetical protein
VIRKKKLPNYYTKKKKKNLRNFSLGPSPIKLHDSVPDSKDNQKRISFQIKTRIVKAKQVARGAAIASQKDIHRIGFLSS